MQSENSMSRKVLCLGAASLFSFYNLLLFSMMNVLSLYLAHDFSYLPKEIGFLGSCDLWGNVVGFLPVGLLLDRYPLRKIGMPLLSIAILSTFAMAYTHYYPLFCVLRFLQGLASAGSLLITMRLGATVFPNNANTTIGVMIFIALAGGIAGNSGFAWLAHQFGWQCGLVMISLLGVIILGIMAIGFSLPHVRMRQSLSFRQILTPYHMLAGIQIGFLNAPVFIIGSLFGNQYLLHKTNLQLEQVAYFSSLLFVGIICGSPIIGYIADKMGNFRLMISGYIILIWVVALLSFTTALSYSMYAFIFFIMGVACCTQNLIYPLLAEFRPNAKSTSMALASILSNATGGLLQIGFGFIAKWYPTQTNMGFNALIILFFIGLLAIIPLIHKTSKIKLP